MVLYLIGIGLSDEKDITLRGLDAVRSSDVVYLENYTSVLGCSKEKLEALYGKSVILADREMVEMDVEKILEEAVKGTVSFLVVGDPFGATTHSDLQLRAHSLGITVHVIHNASVMNAVGVCGLQLYRFGETVSIVFFTPTWRPDSFYDKIAANRSRGLHTLCLLDIKVKEPSEEALCRGKKIYEPPRYMTIGTAIDELLEVASQKEESAYNEETLCVGIARLGAPDQKISFGSMKELQSVDFGQPLHSLIIAGELHPHEQELLEFFKYVSLMHPVEFKDLSRFGIECVDSILVLLEEIMSLELVGGCEHSIVDRELFSCERNLTHTFKSFQSSTTSDRRQLLENVFPCVVRCAKHLQREVLFSKQCVQSMTIGVHDRH